MRGKIVVSAQMPIELRNQAYEILDRECMNISDYIRRCLEKLIDANGNPFTVTEKWAPLVSHLLAELQAGGPEAEELRARLREIAEGV